jgi:hypothetical protein
LPARIAVIGQSGQSPAKVLALAEEVGKLIAQKAGILLTGGTDGIMAAASRGASLAGGLVVGILPGDDRRLANSYVDVPISTGLGFEQRSAVLIHSADSVVMVAGGNGTLGELSMAYQNRKNVVVLEGSGGWADLVRAVAPDGYLDPRQTVKIHYAQTPREAVELAFSLSDQTAREAI